MALEHQLTVAADIGGTHISAAVVDVARRRILEETRTRVPVDSSGAAGSIFAAWGEALTKAAGGRPVTAIGLSMPGPCDYPAGICRIQGLAKYAALYDLSLRDGIRSVCSWAQQLPILLRNDALCFAIGEWFGGEVQNAERLVAVTLGTGFGSAFLVSGREAPPGPGVPPPEQMFYCVPYGHSIADDYFSTRGLLNLHHKRTGRAFKGVLELAEGARSDAMVRGTFEEFSHQLGAFLLPWMGAFGADALVIGGNISRSWPLLQTGLEEWITRPLGIPVHPSRLLENAALLGAGELPNLYLEDA